MAVMRCDACYTSSEGDNKNAGGIFSRRHSYELDRSIAETLRSVFLEAIPHRELHAVVGRRVVGVPGLHCLVEGVDTLNRLLRTARRHIAGLGEQSSSAA